jgi:hypothetical protein
MLHETWVATWVVWVLPRGGGEGGASLMLDGARDTGCNIAPELFYVAKVYFK